MKALALFAVLAAFVAPARASDLVAATPSRLRGADSRALARELVARLERECSGDPKGSPAAAEPRLLMMVPVELLDAIAREGFLNQHQTLTTRGVDRQVDRFAAEQEMAQEILPYDRVGRELLPKYALLDARADGFGSYDLPTRYGEVVVVFKPGVAERATWTWADSLDFSRRAGRFDLGGEANPVFPRPIRYARTASDRNRCGNYCEAQIWGRLDLSDVDYAMVPADRPVPAELGRFRVRAYAYDRVSGGDRAARVRRGRALKAASVSRIVAGAPPPIGAGAPAGSARIEPFEILASTGSPEERRRRVGDLSVAVKSPAVVDELKTAARSSDPFERAQAIFGLSELPDAEFAPLLIQALSDPDPLVEKSAIALASSRVGDPGVAAALDALDRALAARQKDPADDKASGLRRDLARARGAALCPAAP